MNESIRVLQTVDPVEFVKPYYSKLKDTELSILIGSILFLKKIKIKVLESLLGLKKIEIEEKIGRLLQSDLIDGKFTKDSFILTQVNYLIKKKNPHLTLDDRTFLAYMKARFSVSMEELQIAFSLNYKSTIHLLSKFISSGLISIDKELESDKFNVITHYKLRKRAPNEISKTEKEIIGYAMLRQLTTIEEITNNLEKPEHRVQSIIVDMILSDLIICKFEINKSLIQGIQLSLEIDYFQLIFPKREIELFNEQERLVTAYIVLRKLVSIREISSVLNIPRTDVLLTISRLTATVEIPFSMSDKGYIRPINDITINTITELDQIDSTTLFNYRMLLGIITTEKTINIENIRKKMNVKRSDVVNGIIQLFLSGQISGYFKTQETFVLEKIKQPSSPQDVVLQNWERIILGALISEQVISWPKIAALFEIDRDTARERAYSFISRGLTKTIARESAIALLEIPKLPPLIQVENLSEIEQIALGYMSLNTKVSLKDLRSILEMSTIEVYQIVYLLIGSGLIVAKRSKNNFKIIERRSFEPTLMINELHKALQSMIKIIENTTLNQPYISFKILSTKLNLSKLEIIQDISLLVALGYYQGRIDNKKFYKESDLFIIKGKPLCFECGTELEDFKNPCPGCSAISPLCTVCKGALSTNDLIVSCPRCNHKSHSSHLLKWLKIKGECPICKNHITEQQLIKIDANPLF